METCGLGAPARASSWSITLAPAALALCGPRRVCPTNGSWRWASATAPGPMACISLCSARWENPCAAASAIRAARAWATSVRACSPIQYAPPNTRPTPEPNMSPPASAHAVARALLSVNKTIVSYSARADAPPDFRRPGGAKSCRGSVLSAVHVRPRSHLLTHFVAPMWPIRKRMLHCNMNSACIIHRFGPGQARPRSARLPLKVMSPFTFIDGAGQASPLCDSGQNFPRREVEFPCWRTFCTAFWR